MKFKKGQYLYRPSGRNFRVYLQVDDNRIEQVINEPCYFTREEARKRVYELNGWRYRPCRE